MQIALLGLGKMGSAMARLLIKSGCRLTVWNRTAAAAKPLVEAGARLATTPAEAVKDAAVILTILADDAATSSLVFGTAEQPGLLDSMDSGAIHVSCSTISVQLSHRLTEAHRQKHQTFVAAPVFGRPHIAEQGKLWICAAGPTPAVERIRPILAYLSRGLTVVGEEPASAHALKLGSNFMIAAMIQSLSEAFVFAEAAHIDRELFLDTVNNALFQSPFYTQYGKTMLHPPATPGATVMLGVKDLTLVREAASEASCRLPLADYIGEQLRRAGDAGWDNEDWSVGQYRMAQAVSRQAREAK